MVSNFSLRRITVRSSTTAEYGQIVCNFSLRRSGQDRLRSDRTIFFSRPQITVRSCMKLSRRACFFSFVHVVFFIFSFFHFFSLFIKFFNFSQFAHLRSDRTQLHDRGAILAKKCKMKKKKKNMEQNAESRSAELRSDRIQLSLRRITVRSYTILVSAELRSDRTQFSLRRNTVRSYTTLVSPQNYGQIVVLRSDRMQL